MFAFFEKNGKSLSSSSLVYLKFKKLFIIFLFFFLINEFFNVVLEKKALKKTKNVKVNEEKETFVPIIKPLTNKIILNIQAKEEEGFRKFLEQEKWTNNV